MEAAEFTAPLLSLSKTFFLAGQVERKRRSVKCNKFVLVAWAAELPLGRQKPVSALVRG